MKDINQEDRHKELCEARDTGKTIIEAYYRANELTPAGFAVNPNWNKRFTKSLDRYKILEEDKDIK